MEFKEIKVVVERVKMQFGDFYNGNCNRKFM